MLQQQRPAVTPASYAHRPESFPKIIAPNIAPNTAKKITTNAPGLKYSARVENFRELIPIPAISIGSSAFNAKFMEYTQLSANWSGRIPVNLMIMPRIMVHASPGITLKPGMWPRILPSKYRQKLIKIPEPNAT